MRLILYTQYYRTRTPERQAELDHCLRSNLQHPMLDQVVLLREPDAPELPGDPRMPVEVLEEAERLTYASWIRLVRQQPDAIGILINSDIALGTGWEQLQQVLNTPESVLALSRYNPQAEGQPARLNTFPHWTQDTWALRSDAPITDSLLFASGFPIGYPGCDNRIAYVLWSHGLAVKNPCYFITTEHHQAEEARAYDKNADRLYGAVSYVHPTLTLAEPSELEHTIWTRARERCPGVLVNQQAAEQGVHQLLAKDGELEQQFLRQQKSTGEAWSSPPQGCAHSADGSTVWFEELDAPRCKNLIRQREGTCQGKRLDHTVKADVDKTLYSSEKSPPPDDSEEPLLARELLQFGTRSMQYPSTTFTPRGNTINDSFMSAEANAHNKHSSDQSRETHKRNRYAPTKKAKLNTFTRRARSPIRFKTKTSGFNTEFNHNEEQYRRWAKPQKQQLGAPRKWIGQDFAAKNFLPTLIHSQTLTLFSTEANAQISSHNYHQKSYIIMHDQNTRNRHLPDRPRRNKQHSLIHAPQSPAAANSKNALNEKEPDRPCTLRRYKYLRCAKPEEGHKIIDINGTSEASHDGARQLYANETKSLSTPNIIVEYPNTAPPPTPQGPPSQ